MPSEPTVVTGEAINEQIVASLRIANNELALMRSERAEMLEEIDRLRDVVARWEVHGAQMMREHAGAISTVDSLRASLGILRDDLQRLSSDRRPRSLDVH